MVALTTTPHQDRIVVDSVVDGARTAAAVAAGRSRLLGMTYALSRQEPQFVGGDVTASLQRISAHHRVYQDSLFCLAVELTNNLPLAASFDDTRIMLHLLQQQPERASRCSDTDAGCASIAHVGAACAYYAVLKADIHSAGLNQVYREIEIPVLAPTLAMTLGGLRVNVSILEQIEAAHAAQMEIARRQMWEIAGRKINIDAHDEIAAYLDGDANPAAEILYGYGTRIIRGSGFRSRQKHR